ncbi:hypothetical protein BEWA_048790 [Theileria equi strain WA]|uniref:Signal peptide containing protein n=1 Tax=Theileria equi strain WA TaxID=1537102 RepID=L1LAB6_THEEQ|nr:hypothetical protein BEWA_048790 [Theileria equi strain WA]EKX72412.1 hypothetical protein BEWA_048790 [Theileria equi strain WA]|eukprot:XP_004831864.1 hypothetical protein BEWA_048790 [Theileria equi strain WA]
MKFNGLLILLSAWKFCSCGEGDAPKGAIGSDSLAASDEATDSASFLTPTAQYSEFEVVLDISAENNQNVSRGMTYFGGNEEVYFTALEKHLIVSIVDGSCPVWRGCSGVSCRSAKVSRTGSQRLISVFCGGNGKYDYEYFGTSNDGRWMRISRESYNRLISGSSHASSQANSRNGNIVDGEHDVRQSSSLKTHSPGEHRRMRRGSSGDRESSDSSETSHSLSDIMLDITDPIHSGLLIRDRFICGVRLRTFVAIAGSRITRVFAGPFIFWRCNGSDVLDLCTERSRGKYHLLFLRVIDKEGNRTNSYFQGIGKSWSEVEEDKYYEQLGTMEDSFTVESETPKAESPRDYGGMRQESASPELDLVLATKRLISGLTATFTLDIAAPDTSKIHQTEGMREQIKEFVYTPKEGIFNKVVDGQVVLWTAKGDEECAEAQVYARGKKKLIKIRTLLNGRSVFVCFGKDANIWSPLVGSVFYKKLVELRHDDTEEHETPSEPCGFQVSSLVLPLAAMLCMLGV